MIAALGDLIIIQVGYQSRAGILAHPKGSHRLLQARDFDTYRQVKWEKLTRFTPEGKVEKSEIQPGDVLFLAKGQEHFAALVDHPSANIVVANSFYILRTNTKNLLPGYLAWWLNQTPAREYIMSHGSGSLLSFLSVSALSRMELPVPTTELQRNIMKLDSLRKQEAQLLNKYTFKKTALVEAVCLKVISK